MDFETMKYYCTNGLWGSDRLEKLYKAQKLTEAEYTELMGLIPGTEKAVSY